MMDTETAKHTNFGECDWDNSTDYLQDFTNEFITQEIDLWISIIISFSSSCRHILHYVFLVVCDLVIFEALEEIIVTSKPIRLNGVHRHCHQAFDRIWWINHRVTRQFLLHLRIVGDEKYWCEKALQQSDQSIPDLITHGSFGDYGASTKSMVTTGVNTLTTHTYDNLFVGSQLQTKLMFEVDDKVIILLYMLHITHHFGSYQQRRI